MSHLRNYATNYIKSHDDANGYATDSLWPKVESDIAVFQFTHSFYYALVILIKFFHLVMKNVIFEYDIWLNVTLASNATNYMKSQNDANETLKYDNNGHIFQTESWVCHCHISIYSFHYIVVILIKFFHLMMKNVIFH